MKKTLVVLSMFCLLTSLVFAMNLSGNDSITEENVSTDDLISEDVVLDNETINDSIEIMEENTDLNNDSVEENITEEINLDNESAENEIEENVTIEESDLEEIINKEFEGQMKITPSDRKVGIMFGHSVAVKNNYLVVGAIFDDENGLGSGSVYVFKFDGNEWVEEQKLIASDGKAGDLFGDSVFIDGDSIKVNSYKGSEYVFEFNGEEWVEEKKSEIQEKTILRKSFSSKGCTIESNFDEEENSYLVYVSKKGESKKELTASDGKEDNLFGSSVSVDGDKAVVGAVFDGEEGIGSGAVYVYGL